MRETMHEQCFACPDNAETGCYRKINSIPCKRIGEDTPADERITLLKMLDEEYDFTGSWWGNGCEHGFKPAKSCQNENCNLRKMQELWDYVFKR